MNQPDHNARRQRIAFLALLELARLEHAAAGVDPNDAAGALPWEGLEPHQWDSYAHQALDRLGGTRQDSMDFLRGWTLEAWTETPPIPDPRQGQVVYMEGHEDGPPLVVEGVDHAAERVIFSDGTFLDEWPSLVDSVGEPWPPFVAALELVELESARLGLTLSGHARALLDGLDLPLPDQDVEIPELTEAHEDLVELHRRLSDYLGHGPTGAEGLAHDLGLPESSATAVAAALLEASPVPGPRLVPDPAGIADPQLDPLPELQPVLDQLDAPLQLTRPLQRLRVAPQGDGLAALAAEAVDELRRARAVHGVQHGLPSFGTTVDWPEEGRVLEDQARGELQATPSWAAIFTEEVGETLRADPQELRGELVQVTAMGLGWLSKLDADAPTWSFPARARDTDGALGTVYELDPVANSHTFVPDGAEVPAILGAGVPHPYRYLGAADLARLTPVES